MPFTFEALATLALGASSPFSFATPPTFASRADKFFFRPRAFLFFFMQAPISFKARLSAKPLAQPHKRVSLSAPGGSYVFTTLSLGSAFASTTVTVSHAASSAFLQPTLGLLPPPVKPGALTANDRTTIGTMFTG